MKEYLVIDLPPSAADATALLNKHASRDGWQVKNALYYGENTTGVILERDNPDYRVGA